MDFGPADVLFIGKGRTVSCHYRMCLPARALGSDWVGVAGDPDDLEVGWGTVREVDWDKYKVYVVQLVEGELWLRKVVELQQKGKIVIYEVDDDLAMHEGHENAIYWGPERVQSHFDVMHACDAVSCSTQWLADKYADMLMDTFFNRTGLDLERYPERPHRPDGKTMVWAGGVGHREAFDSWRPGIKEVLEEVEGSRLLLIGTQAVEKLAGEYPGRVARFPYVTLQNFPWVLATGDLALGPAAQTDFFRAKSDLRYLEASALGIPGVYDSEVYSEHAARSILTRPDICGQAIEFSLRSTTREVYGPAAFEYVQNERSMQTTSNDWIDMLEKVVP